MTEQKLWTQTLEIKTQIRLKSTSHIQYFRGAHGAHYSSIVPLENNWEDGDPEFGDLLGWHISYGTTKFRYSNELKHINPYFITTHKNVSPKNFSKYGGVCHRKNKASTHRR